MTTLDALLADPEWFPESLDSGRGLISFARVTADGLRETPFLDKRMNAIITERRMVGLADAMKAWRAGKARKTHMPAFIFHSAFCCSTLLARALDAPGTCIALKEPDILMALANSLRIDERLKRDSRAANQLVDFIFELLGRRFASGERVLVKPTNSANNLLPHALRVKAPTLIIYGDLRSFLVSVIKKGEPCKAFVRLQYNIFVLDEGGLAAIPHRQAMGLTDLQAAAMVWRHQLELFAGELAQPRAGNPASLDFRVLLDDPAASLAAASKHLGLRHSSAALNETANGPVFRQNSKDSGEDYDSARRDAEEAALDAAHGETLDLIVPWGLDVNLGRALVLPLPRPLGA